MANQLKAQFFWCRPGVVRELYNDMLVVDTATATADAEAADDYLGDENGFWFRKGAVDRLHNVLAMLPDDLMELDSLE